ncbi:hypothetical protein M0802_002256 [Mischocyttarus mexicanus]|nr:hypothetical protein M0802_002256 [Mischocyttarus mexicanus]
MEEEDDALEGYDADYQEGEEIFLEETDYRRRVKEDDSKKEKKLWSLKECYSIVSITDKDDIDEDYMETSEPLLAHRLHVSSEKFDLCLERKKIYEELGENEIKNDLLESVNRISRELMQMVENGVETNKMIGSLVLRLILEEVVLTIDFVDHEEDSNGRGKSKIRSKLRSKSISKLQTNDFVNRRLPWHLINPSHERGNIGRRLNINLRDLIGDILGGNKQTELELAYVSDVTCFHTKELNMFEKRCFYPKTETKVLSSWKTGTDNRELVELRFYLFAN